MAAWPRGGAGPASRSGRGDGAPVRGSPEPLPATGRRCDPRAGRRPLGAAAARSGCRQDRPLRPARADARLRLHPRRRVRGPARRRAARQRLPRPARHVYRRPQPRPRRRRRRDAAERPRGRPQPQLPGSRWRPIGSARRPRILRAAARSRSRRRGWRRGSIRRVCGREVTIWFHQHRGRGRCVRAWGQSVPAARRFAELGADRRFRRHARGRDGTAPNWQNHALPGHGLVRRRAAARGSSAAATGSRGWTSAIAAPRRGRWAKI